MRWRDVSIRLARSSEKVILVVSFVIGQNYGGADSLRQCDILSHRGIFDCLLN
jgi:hypothetical protein